MMTKETYIAMHSDIYDALTAESFSDLSIVLQNVSRATGYEYEMLAEILSEAFEDGAENALELAEKHNASSFEYKLFCDIEHNQAIESVITTAYEQDY